MNTRSLAGQVLDDPEATEREKTLDVVRMSAEMLRALQPGDLIRHISSSTAIVVTANYGNRVTAVRTYDVTNPSEWEVVTPRRHD